LVLLDGLQYIGCIHSVRHSCTVAALAVGVVCGFSGNRITRRACAGAGYSRGFMSCLYFTLDVMQSFALLR
jgi:hypothetical protein